MKALVLTVVLLLKTLSLTAADLPALSDKIKAVIERSEFKTMYPDAELYGSGRNVKFNDLDEALPAAVVLWISDRRNDLYLTWWEHRDRSVRMLIAFLLFGEEGVVPENMRLKLAESVDRFSEVESRERKEELSFIEKNRHEFANWFVRKLKPLLGEKRLSGFRQK